MACNRVAIDVGDHGNKFEWPVKDGHEPAKEFRSRTGELLTLRCVITRDEIVAAEKVVAA